LNWRFGRRVGRGALAALLAVTLVVGSVPAAFGAEKAAKPGQVDRVLRDKAAREPNATIPVLVQRKSAKAGSDAVAKRGGKVKKSLGVGNAVAVDLPAKQVEALAREPGVLRVSYDAPMRSTGVAEPISADKLRAYYAQAVGSSPLWDWANGTVQGTGVGIAVLDSGVEMHGDFNGPDRRTRIVAHNQIVPTAGAGRRDDSGHGTFVAGIAAGRGWAGRAASDNNRYVGTAPNANVISVKVSNKDGVARTSDVIEGILWTIANKQRHNIRVINMSIAQTTPESYKTSLLSAAVELAWMKGIVVVVSSGNLGPNTALYPPANDPYAIVVGATDDNATAATGDDTVATFSSYGTTQDGLSKPDLVAPGRRIVAPLSNKTDRLGVLYADRITDNIYIRMSGTSAAAPVVTGVVAQLLQAKPNLTPDQVKWLLLKTARPLGGAGTGAGYPDATAAVRYSGAIGQANQDARPNNYLIALHLLTGGRTIAGTTASGTTSWDTTSWDTTSWDTTSWDTTSWDTTSWDTTSWDTTSWDTTSWDTTSWDTTSWDTTSWDTTSWDTTSWDTVAGD
jgi:serine protease AprX